MIEEISFLYTLWGIYADIGTLGKISSAISDYTRLPILYWKNPKNKTI